MKIFVAIAATLLAATGAQASHYAFTFVGANYSVTDGSFNTSGPANADGTFNITRASGTLTSTDTSQPHGAFTLTPGNGVSLSTADGQENYSNLYTRGAASFADAGLEVQGAGLEANFYNGVNANYSACAGNCASVPNSSFYNPGDLGTLTITAVPEPATWTMIIAGFAGLGVALRRRRAGVAFAA